jgi:hypothetical protein
MLTSVFDGGRQDAATCAARDAPEIVIGNDEH